jgi:hypothetical protein
MDNHNDFYKKLVDNLYDGVYFVDRGASSLTGTKVQSGSRGTPPLKPSGGLAGIIYSII